MVVMRLIRQLTDSDFYGGDPVLMNKVSRFASRGVLVDDSLNIAMMFMSKPKLYKLPGGGIEEGETKEEAFLREIREETGCTSEIIDELGYFEEHKYKNDFMQHSYCFIARVINSNSELKLTESESQLGMEVKWMEYEEAIHVMNHSEWCGDDYSTQFMIARDKIILDEALHKLEVRLF